jgi:PAS domain S-box-containing protein
MELAVGGRILPLRVSASALKQREDTAVCILATDLTEVEEAARKLERVRVEHQALRESDLRLRNSLAGAAVGLAITRADGRFAEVNPTFCRIVGYSANEMKGLTYRHLMHPDDCAEYERLATRLEAAEINSFVVENRYVRKDGKPVWVRKSVSQVRDLSGVPHGHLAFVEDVSERKLAEEQNADQLAELQRWQAVMLDREDRIMELKREVNELLRRQGEPIRYPSQAGEDAETRGTGDTKTKETRRRGDAKRQNDTGTR